MGNREKTQIFLCFEVLHDQLLQFYQAYELTTFYLKLRLHLQEDSLVIYVKTLPTMMKINLPLYYRIIKIYKMIEANQPRQTRTNKQIVFIVCIYIILTASNRFSTNSIQSDQTIIAKIQKKSQIKIQTFLNEIDKQKFEGQWTQKNKIQKPLLANNNGKFELEMMRYSQNEGSKFAMEIIIKNGQYIDDGLIEFKMSDLQTNWTLQYVQNKLIATLALHQNITVSFIKQVILQTESRGQFNVSNVQIRFSIVNNTLVKELSLITQNQQILFNLKRQKYNMSGTILFALILFIISYSQFSACLDILRKFIEGQENPINYSFFTLVMTMMWDAALCITSFIFAFKNQQNIVLFVIPAFILCLLFTNLQLRIMITVFQAISGQNQPRNVICRFNLISYGAIIAMYPIIVYTNLGTSLFLSFSLIFLPQIYTNALTGTRPNLNSVFYNQFLLYRFLIVLYLKCFPYNIFQLKPNYLLGFGTLILVGCQFGLLWVQKMYGPKKVMPKFLLPPIYNYGFSQFNGQYGEGSSNVVSQQCSICLEALQKNPEAPPPQYPIEHRLMKTPCGHKYHGICLIQWMKLKMQCPQCRSKLPAYQ